MPAAENSNAADQVEAKKGSDLSRAFSEDGKLKTHVGGQALIEGVMMRGRFNWAVAVREPEGGIYLEEHDLNSGKKKNSWMYWPFVRGCTAMCESLVLGYKALEIAAIHAFGTEEDEDKQPDKKKEQVGEGLAAASGKAVSVDGEVPAAGEASVGEGASCEAPASAPLSAVPDSANDAAQDAFSWARDFGRPDTVLDALGAQTTLEPVAMPEPAEAAGFEPIFEPAEAVDFGAMPEPAEAADSVSAAELADAASAAAEAQPTKASEDEDEGEFGHTEMMISMVLGIVLGVVLFIVAPAFITNLLVGEYDGNVLAWNIVDGVVRVAVFVLYLWLIGRMEDLKRMFAYHGAEHKTIHCYEHGLPLTPENARSFPRLHVRCGTAFLIMVMIIAILVYTILPVKSLIAALGVPNGLPKLLLVILVRILFLPLIAGISYEITVKWAGSHPDNPLVKVILWPGMQMQYLTTNEPDDSMLECAIASMKLVLDREEREAALQNKEDIA